MFGRVDKEVSRHVVLRLLEFDPAIDLSHRPDDDDQLLAHQGQMLKALMEAAKMWEMSRQEGRYSFLEQSDRRVYKVQQWVLGDLPDYYVEQFRSLRKHILRFRREQKLPSIDRDPEGFMADVEEGEYDQIFLPIRLTSSGLNVAA